jgi:hypothetical protein
MSGDGLRDCTAIGNPSVTPPATSYSQPLRLSRQPSKHTDSLANDVPAASGAKKVLPSSALLGGSRETLRCPSRRIGSRNQDGHYVVAIGFDDANIYFMDPSISGRRGYLSWREFKQRWHENEGTETEPDVHQRLGIWIRPPRGGTPFLRYTARVD